MENQDAYQQAKKRVQVKLGFKNHLIVYVVVSSLLLIINLSTSNDYLWAKWPIMGWGIGVLFHGLSAYVFPSYSAITDEMVRKEMEKTDNT